MDEEEDVKVYVWVSVNFKTLRKIANLQILLLFYYFEHITSA